MSRTTRDNEEFLYGFICPDDTPVEVINTGFYTIRGGSVKDHNIIAKILLKDPNQYGELTEKRVFEKKDFAFMENVRPGKPFLIRTWIKDNEMGIEWKETFRAKDFDFSKLDKDDRILVKEYVQIYIRDNKLKDLLENDEEKS